MSQSYLKLKNKYLNIGKVLLLVIASFHGSFYDLKIGLE